jgi:hypothetical protein
MRLKQDGLLQDDDGILALEEKDVFIRHAVTVYSRSRPREKAYDMAGTNGYEFALPSDWVEDFSAPRSIEYPLGDQQPTFIPIEDVALYRSPTGLKLRFLRDTIATTKTARLLYTVPHTVSDTTSTIPSTDEDGVAAAAAGLACEALANHYAKTTDSTIGADAVSYRTKSQEYAARAKRLMALFRESLGLKEDGAAAPASGVRDWGSEYQWGEDRLQHPKDRR